jgi:hypothetical protein
MHCGAAHKSMDGLVRITTRSISFCFVFDHKKLTLDSDVCFENCLIADKTRRLKCIVDLIVFEI